MSNKNGWIGVDLDGTLAFYDGWVGADFIGHPIPKMVARILTWLEQGKSVKIFTARVADDPDGVARKHIEDWLFKHLGQHLPITCQKDYGMVELWDDRCVRVVANTGEPCCGS